MVHTQSVRLPAILIRVVSLVLILYVLLALGACSGQNSTPEPTKSAVSPSSSSNTQGTWTAGNGESEWGTYSLASEEFGNVSVELPSRPSEEIGEDGNLRVLVNAEGSAEAQFMVLVEPLDDSEFTALTPMNAQEREEQLHWYALDFVGAETFVENMRSAPYEGNVGVRYRASNFNAEVWTILVIDGDGGWVYSVCAYSYDSEPTPEEAEATQRFMNSFYLS